MAQVAAAAAAVHLCAHHAEAAIGLRLDRAGLRVIEARPTRAALELLLRDEQRLLAAGAREGAGTLLEVERAAARRLGAVLPHDLILLGREQLAPFRIGVADGVGLGRCCHRYCLT